MNHIHTYLSYGLSGLITGLTCSSCIATLPQTNPSPAVGNAAACAITQPLTTEETEQATVAWQYFLNNRQASTGFINAADQYPSGTLWDMGNYVAALNAVRWMGLIDQAEFDRQFQQFITSLDALPTVDNTLPNKVYNSATGKMVDYSNTPTDEGLGWSALDIGRMLVALHIVRVCHPHHTRTIEKVVSNWPLKDSVKKGQLYGAIVQDDGTLQLVQEGRLGYEEYAARGYELWGFSVDQALALEPAKMVEIYGVEIPVDSRDFASTDANNYVVSESYILEALEFGLSEETQRTAANVFDIQKTRHEKTGILTAVTEDNIDQAPHFLYSTLYANGEPWAVITDANEAYPELRTLSTKAAFGWHALFPEDAYAQTLLDTAQTLKAPDGKGFYAGQYEATGKPNTILTSNTNGLILETLYYQTRNQQPVITEP